MEKINKSILNKIFKPKRNSRKGDNGVLLIIAGSEKYHGAPWYSIEIASRIVDLVYFHSDKMTMRLMNEIKKKSPSFITVRDKELPEILKKSDSVLVGPGWGENLKNKNLLNNLLIKNKNKKFILDADALKLISKKNLNKNCLVTPHAGEFTKLFKKVANIENVKKAACQYNYSILLKGVKDVICSSQACFYNISGNQGMTKGGTGDVLAGLAAAFACKNDLLTAAKAGAYACGLAGDKLYKKYSVFYNAKDLIEEIPRVLKN